jgi:hypothetical protein
MQVVECLLSKQEALNSNHSTRKRERAQAPVAHACNPSYSGGRDQEDQGLKPAWGNSS